VRYTKRMENAVLPYEHTYIPVVVYAIPLIILIIWLLCIFIGLRLAARIIKINSEKTSRSQAGDQPQVLVESEQKRIYSQESMLSSYVRYTPSALPIKCLNAII